MYCTVWGSFFITVTAISSRTWPGAPSLPIGYNRTIGRMLLLEQTTVSAIGRRLAPTTGNNQVLIVRVNGNGGSETTSTLEEIETTVFNGGPNAADQFEECSGGALTLTNAGAIEITLPYSVGGRATDTDQELQDDLTRLVEEQVGATLPGQYDNVLFCMPEGSTVEGDPNWVGFGELGGFKTFYNDGNCQRILTVMHEMGHNMGLGHSCQLSDGNDINGEYGDRTCIMGIDDTQTRKCFNAPQSKLLGWYDEEYYTTLDVPPATNTQTCLFGVAEYASRPDSNEYQLWYQIGDIFISFNRDTGPNGQTQECKDQVVIHQAPIISPQGIENSSDRIECLQPGQAYEGDGFSVNVADIDTSTEPSCARISIVVQPTESPTPAPGTTSPDATRTPTAFPTTEMYQIDYFVNNFPNPDDVTIIVIDSCGEEVGRQDLLAGQSTDGSFFNNVEDQYRFLIQDAGGDGGATYAVSYRGVPQVANAQWNTAEECHIIGEAPPRCDDISCPSGGPTIEPVPTPATTTVPTQTTTTVPTTPVLVPTVQPVESPMASPIDSSLPSPTLSNTIVPTLLPGVPTPSLSVLPTSIPVPTLLPGPTLPPAAAGGLCEVEVRVEECPPLIASQPPIPGCDCYNYCDGAFLACCPLDEFCPVSCPSGDFVGGCRLVVESPTLTPSADQQPTFRPLPPSRDDPTLRPLPPSRDDPLPTTISGSCQIQVRQEECSALLATQTPIDDCSCYFYCDGGFAGCCPLGDVCPIECPSGDFVGGCRLEEESPTSMPVEVPTVTVVEIPAYPFFFWSDGAVWATSISRNGRFGNRKESGRKKKVRFLSSRTEKKYHDDGSPL